MTKSTGPSKPISPGLRTSYPETGRVLPAMFDPSNALSIGNWVMNRVTHKTVVFIRPFVLDNTEGEFPPGTYTIETEEELLDTISFPAYRRLSTVMQFAESNGMTSFIKIEPVALDRALVRDARVD